MGLLNELGIDKEVYEEASESTVGEGFSLLESGVYDGEIKNVIIYKNPYFDATMLRVEIDVDGRILSFRKDVGKLLQSGEPNKGFVSRLKSIAKATNVDINDMTIGKDIQFKMFGKDVDGKQINGVNGKKVKVLVRKSLDTDRPEDDQYRESNDIEGITWAGSEDIEKFTAKVEKHNGIFKWKSGYKPKKTSAEPTEDQKKAVEDMDF